MPTFVVLEDKSWNISTQVAGVFSSEDKAIDFIRSQDGTSSYRIAHWYLDGERIPS